MQFIIIIKIKTRQFFSGANEHGAANYIAKLSICICFFLIFTVTKLCEVA